MPVSLKIQILKNIGQPKLVAINLANVYMTECVFEDAWRGIVYST